jgi:hypothetical protein
MMFESLTLDDFDNIECEYLIKDLIPKNKITLYYADGGTGKTWISFAISKLLTARDNLIISYFDFDNPLSVLKERNVPKHLISQKNFYYVHNTKMTKEPIEMINNIGYQNKDLSNQLYIFDSLRNIVDVKHLRKSMQTMNSLMDIRELGGTIILIGHSNDRGKFEGNSNFKNSLDVMFKVSKSIYQKENCINIDFEVQKERVQVKNQSWSIDTNTLDMTLQDEVLGGMTYLQKVQKDKFITIMTRNDDVKITQTQLLKTAGFRRDDKTAINTLKVFTGYFWMAEKKGKTIYYKLI